MFQKFAADIGIVTNQSKKEHHVGFVGLGSVTSIRMFHRGEVARQHGEIVSNTESPGYTVNLHVAERQARLRAAQAGWTVMGRFSSAECSQ